MSRVHLHFVVVNAALQVITGKVLRIIHNWRTTPLLMSLQRIEQGSTAVLNRPVEDSRAFAQGRAAA